MEKLHPACLVLADGTFFRGEAFGALDAEAHGELVFSTSMTGYPELLTDPSYCEQILTLTTPEIGNYGVTAADFESHRIWASGLVIRSLSPIVSNWRSEMSLDTWLKQEKIPGICSIDTRALVRHLRDAGSMMSILSTHANVDVAELTHRAKNLPGMAGRDLMSKVTCKSAYEFGAGNNLFHVVAVDYGVKHNMLRILVQLGCRVTVVPASMSADAIMGYAPDGVLLSNGPGDPKAATGAIKTIKNLLGKVPIFGICMGHQILCLALGGSTYKLKFGHRGGNQPVRTETGRVMMTSQNHGFAVEHKKDVDFSRINISDDTVEGMDRPDLWAFSVQYHPEAAPGPHDARWEFDKFINMMKAFNERQTNRG